MTSMQMEAAVTAGAAERLDFPIEGMTCAACVRRVENALSTVPGVQSSSVNLITERATVVVDPARATARDLEAAVERAGYHAHFSAPNSAPKAADDEGDEARGLRRDFLTALVCAVPLLVLGMSHGVVPAFAGSAGRTAQLLLATLVVFGPGRRFFRLAWTALRHRSADMNTLVSLGTGAAYGWSLVVVLAPGLFPHAEHGQMPPVYFEAAGAIVTFLLLGKGLEARARKRLSDAVRGLVALRPTTAHRLEGERIVDVDVDDLAVGDRVLVRGGERVPADAEVIEGASAIDESMFTGESLPIDKTVGARVIGGSLNGAGALTVRVTRVGRDAALARIVEAVEQAQGSKAPIARLADRVSGVFVPVVVGIALVTLLGWTLVDPSAHGLAVAVEHFVAVLVIACPCALGLATPAAIAVATGRGAELGILVRGGASLEGAARIDTVLFDKTGTLTEGKPRVASIVALTGNESDLLAYAAAVESRSEHPIARAVVAAAAELPPRALRDFRTSNGLGVEGSVDGRRVHVGAASWLTDAGIVVGSGEETLGSMMLRGETPVLVALDGELAGVLGISDRVHETTPEVITALRRMGIELAVVSGDRSEVVAAVAGGLGIEELHANVRPEGKARVVAAARARGRHVAMVGDGVNDAPALAAADVGIAIGHGADVAVAAADVALLRGGITALPVALSLARATMRTIRQNLFWAFAYNVVGIPIAAGVLEHATGWSLSPVLASAAMSLSSVSVLLSSLRLRSFSAASARV